MSWCTDQRQAWIAQILRVYGYITRGHLQRMFGISQPQGSLDLSTFRRAHPQAMRYDSSRKCYVHEGAEHAEAQVSALMDTIAEMVPRDDYVTVCNRVVDAETQLAALRAALELIRDHGDEDDEWDAVDRYQRVRDMATVALLTAPPQEPQPHDGEQGP